MQTLLMIAFSFLAVLMWKTPTVYTGILIIFYSVFNEFIQSTPIIKIGGSIYASDIILLLTLFYLFISFWSNYSAWKWTRKLTLILLIFLLYGLVSIMRGVMNYGAPGIGEARKNLLFIVFSFYVAVSYTKWSDVDKLLRLIVNISAVVAVASLCLILYYYSLGQLKRVMPATGGLLLADSFIVTFGAFLTKSVLRVSRFKKLMLLTIFLASIFLNGHRSAWVGAAAGIMTLVVFHYGALSFQGVAKSSLILALIAASTLGAYSLVFAKLFPDLSSDFQEKRLAFIEKGYEEDYSAHWRTLAWAVEMNRIQKHPLFGTGFGNRLELPTKVGWKLLPTHNGHLTVLSRQGIIGYLIFLSLLFGTWYRVMRCKVSQTDISTRSRKLILTSLLVTNIVFSAFYSFEYLLWFVLGIAFLFIHTFGSKIELRDV